jgi:hypothetical protein
MTKHNDILHPNMLNKHLVIGPSLLSVSGVTPMYKERIILMRCTVSCLPIVNMDRFISLCNGDVLFMTDDPERNDPLPVESRNVDNVLDSHKSRTNVNIGFSAVDTEVTS